MVKIFLSILYPCFLNKFKSSIAGNLVIKDRNTATISSCPKELTGRVGGVALVVDKKKFSGRVIDENGVGIPFASVFIKGTEEGTAGDSTGFFELTTKAHEKKIILVASCVGYTSVEKQITNAKENSADIILVTNATLNGEVVVAAANNIRLGSARISWVQRSYLEKVKDFFSSDSIKVFPNPAKAGSEIKIQWKKAEPGEYNIGLFNLQGQLIQSSSAIIDSKTAVIAFHIPQVIPGSYMLRLTNKMSGKKHVEKIIIQ